MFVYEGIPADIIEHARRAFVRPKLRILGRELTPDRAPLKPYRIVNGAAVLVEDEVAPELPNLPDNAVEFVDLTDSPDNSPHNANPKRPKIVHEVVFLKVNMN